MIDLVDALGFFDQIFTIIVILDRVPNKPHVINFGEILHLFFLVFHTNVRPRRPREADRKYLRTFSAQILSGKEKKNSAGMYPNLTLAE